MTSSRQLLALLFGLLIVLRFRLRFLAVLLDCIDNYCHVTPPSSVGRKRQTAKVVFLLRVAVAGCSLNKFKLLLILVGNLEHAVSVGVTEALDESATLGRIQTHPQLRSVRVKVAPLENEEVSCAPIGSKRAAVNIVKRTSNLVGSCINRNIRLKVAYSMPEDCRRATLRAKRGSCQGFIVPTITPAAYSTSRSIPYTTSVSNWSLSLVG